MDFHPGGPEELMKGVGTDASKLFNEVRGSYYYTIIQHNMIIILFLNEQTK